MSDEQVQAPVAADDQVPAAAGDQNAAPAQDATTTAVSAPATATDAVAAAAGDQNAAPAQGAAAPTEAAAPAVAAPADAAAPAPAPGLSSLADCVLCDLIKRVSKLEAMYPVMVALDSAMMVKMKEALTEDDE